MSIPTEEHPSFTSDDGNLSDLLAETRIMLSGAQLLTGFLMMLPFNGGFARIPDSEKWGYLVTFVCAILSLVIFNAPAAQHRLEWPLHRRVRFKSYATRMVILGMFPFSIALITGTHLTLTQALGFEAGNIGAGLVALLILWLWWVIPLQVKGDI